MKNFKITVEIKIDHASWDTLIWQTCCDDYAQAMSRAVSFASMALNECRGESIISIKVEDTDVAVWL